MLKYTYFLFLIIVLFSCKGQKKEIVTTDTAEEIIKPFDIAALYQNFHNNPLTQFQKEENAIIDFAAEKELPMQRSSSGLYYHIIPTGSGPKIIAGQIISAHYTGKQLNGNIFDSSYQRNTPIQFRKGEMIAGWNEVVSYMRKGDKAILLVPSHLAYKDQGMQGYVEPNEVLYFDLEIVDVASEM